MSGFCTISQKMYNDGYCKMETFYYALYYALFNESAKKTKKEMILKRNQM